MQPTQYWWSVFENAFGNIEIHLTHAVWQSLKKFDVEMCNSTWNFKFWLHAQKIRYGNVEGPSNLVFIEFACGNVEKTFNPLRQETDWS